MFRAQEGIPVCGQVGGADAHVFTYVDRSFPLNKFASCSVVGVPERFLIVAQCRDCILGKCKLQTDFFSPFPPVQSHAGLCCAAF